MAGRPDAADRVHSMALRVLTLCIFAAAVVLWLWPRQPARIIVDAPHASVPLREVPRLGADGTALAVHGSLLDQAIDSAARYLRRTVQADGRFVYRINLRRKSSRNRYNVLRHAGTIYALAQYLEHRDDPAVRSALLKAAKYLRDRHVAAVPGRDGLLAVWSLPGEEIREGPRQAKLGGAGLGLIALLAARRHEPDLIPIADLRALASFVLFMQQDNGRFRSKFRQGQFIRGFESLYYPGEAILALVHLYHADPDRRWLEAAVRGVAYLIDSRRDAQQLPADHWLMIAIRALIPQLKQLPRPAIGADLMLAHARALAETMVAEQRTVQQGLPTSSPLAGGFAIDGRCTPTATRLEGLLALERALLACRASDCREFRSTLQQPIAAGIRFILGCQVAAGPGEGGVLRAVRPLKHRRGGFNRRQTEIRIDYVQHVLSALLDYRYRRPAEPPP